MADRTPRRIDQVEPGLYKFRRVKDGPYMAAEIIVQDGMIQVREDGAQASIGISTAAYADMVVESTMDGEAFRNPLLRIVWFGSRIDEAEYRYLIALGEWARRHEPGHPAADPDQPIRMNAVPIRLLF